VVVGNTNYQQHSSLLDNSLSGFENSQLGMDLVAKSLVAKSLVAATLAVELLDFELLMVAVVVPKLGAELLV
jgi:hypothetical protein